MTQISDVMREAVRQRANGRCEYCLIPEAFFSRHEADHIRATQHRGKTRLENLAFACFDCNRRKGPNIASFDPATNALTRLFDPRRDSWADHFQLDGGRILGRTAIGRATEALLQFNDQRRVLVRTQLQKVDRYPI